LSGLRYAVMIAILVSPTAIGAEVLLVKGMGRLLGWPVATSDGRIRFRDCGGTLHEMGDGRLTPTDRRCTRREPFALEGTAIVVDRDRALLVIETATGTRSSFLVARSAAGVLADLVPGRRVRVEGPVPGRADRVAVE